MTAYYLLDATVSEKEPGIKLTFYNPSNKKWKIIVDADYRPYFFIPYPIPEEDYKQIQELGLGIEIVEKTDLFTRKTVKLTKVKFKDFSDHLQISRMFSKSWESEVPVVSSYMFDTNLVFGAKYRLKGKEIVPLRGVSKEDLKTFRRAFAEIRKTDPEKYKLSERLFILCSQPVPEVSLNRFGIKKVDSEELHSMFMRARLANIPIPLTYHNRKVSVWIKSILHNYLRKNNILIPTDNELRRGEETHRIKGALTLTPEPGVHFNTVVVDFDSMYPSLIDSFNLSHETIDCDHEECHNNKVPKLSHHVCTQIRGVYSVVIGSLKDLRIHWFKPRSKDKTLSEEEIRWLIKEAKKRLKLDLSVEVRYNLCVLPEAAKAYFGIKKDGTYDLKGLTAIKSNSPNFIYNVFDECIQELTTVTNKSEFNKAKRKIKPIVQDAIDDLVLGDIPIEDLEYAVVIHDDPKEKVKGKSLHQPYQCAVQLIDSGKTVKKWDEMRFVKVKPFNYNGRKFTVKPTDHIKRSSEINVVDYIRNLRTALNQTFEPMGVIINDLEKGKRTLFDFS